MKDLQEIMELLGGERTIRCRPTNEMDFVGLVRRGLPVQSALFAAKSLAIGEEQTFSWLHISRKTAARRKSEHQPLRAIESERLLRLVRLAAAATDTLGNREKAVRWLQKQNRALADQTPVALLDTDLGFQTVMDVLQRIEHGIVG